VQLDQIVDPVKWWRTNKENFPVMASLARKYLDIVDSYIGTHRIYSKDDHDDIESGWRRM